MKRILMVLAALMVAMVVASALPAFADKGGIRGLTKQETSGDDCVNFNDCQDFYHHCRVVHTAD